MKTALSFLISLTAFASYAQNKYEVFIDLNKIKKDKIKVTMNVPAIKEDKATYIMPSVIPGSYAQKDFGRFIEDFKAFDKNGKKLKTNKEGQNLFHISTATQLHHIEYNVNDTWDAADTNFVFQPGGTNIEAEKNVMINHAGFWGYFDGYKMLPYEINVTKPAGFYGATALDADRKSPTIDILRAPDYVRLADNPVMYSRPDTLSFLSGNTTVHIAVFSETGLIKSSLLKRYIEPLAASLTKFFGQMPVDKYHFIMYFPVNAPTEITRYGGFGALEHSYSSFYFLPEMEDEKQLSSMILSVGAHEFLHILTPLNIHSEEIEFFDFKDPKMSQHLWMYEGVTEYFSNLIQVREGFYKFNDFVFEMNEKLKKAEEFPLVSFTEMSRGILTDRYKDMYMNVYNKGALIGLLLDIKLHELSAGKLGLKDVMMQLSKKYGPNTPFKDDELFSDITSISYPEIGAFLNDHVAGTKPLPYKEYFNKIGVNFVEERIDSIKTFGLLGFSYDEKRKLFLIAETPSGNNTFGLENGDVILSVNNIELTIANYPDLLNPLIEASSDLPVTIEYARNNKAAVVTSKAVTLPIPVKNVLEINSSPSNEQKEMRLKMFNTTGLN